jgi:uncharacterized surface protein with fasciclin (FAS1) repeats
MARPDASALHISAAVSEKAGHDAASVHAAVKARPKPAQRNPVSGCDEAVDPVSSVVRRLELQSKMETVMSKRFALFASAAILALAAMAPVPLSAQMSEKTVTVGGAPMYPSKNIIQNAVNSKDHTTLVAAVKAAGLVDTLSGPGPFTVFAPTNAAFAKLPAGTVDTLLKPENKATLTKVLTYHVVAGRMTAARLMKAVKDGEGLAKLKTVEGETITVKQAGPGKLSVTDAKGDVAMVTIADVMQSNGVIHVIDTVLLPN